MQNEIRLRDDGTIVIRYGHNAEENGLWWGIYFLNNGEMIPFWRSELRPLEGRVPDKDLSGWARLAAQNFFNACSLALK